MNPRIIPSNSSLETAQLYRKMLVSFHSVTRFRTRAMNASRRLASDVVSIGRSYIEVMSGPQRLPDLRRTGFAQVAFQAGVARGVSSFGTCLDFPRRMPVKRSYSSSDGPYVPLVSLISPSRSLTTISPRCDLIRWLDSRIYNATVPPGRRTPSIIARNSWVTRKLP